MNAMINIVDTMIMIINTMINIVVAMINGVDAMIKFIEAIYINADSIQGQTLSILEEFMEQKNHNKEHKENHNKEHSGKPIYVYLLLKSNMMVSNSSSFENSVLFWSILQLRYKQFNKWRDSIHFLTQN